MTNQRKSHDWVLKSLSPTRTMMLTAVALAAPFQPELF
jgi:hypothetical protein